MRSAVPFLSGVTGGAAIIIGLLIAWNSRVAIREVDWAYFTVQILCAACIVAGGALILFTALELRTE